VPAARQTSVNVPEGLDTSPWTLTNVLEDTVQSPLVDLGDNLAGGEGRIKAVHICGESSNDTGRLKLQLEDLWAESEPTAPTAVVPELILVVPSFLRVQVIN